MIFGRSLSRRLAVLTSLGFALIWGFAILAMALTLQSEQEELLDLTLRETAGLFHPVLVDRWKAGESGPLRAGAEPRNPDETLVYLLLRADGEVLLQSEALRGVDPVSGPPEKGYHTTATHVFYTTETDPEGYAVAFGDPLSERRDAYGESLLAFLLPMLGLLPLAYLMVGWIARTALRPLGLLRAEIAARDEGRLDPIDTSRTTEELRAITATLNGFMIRLGRALEAERAFATNAAHELRTPVAVALAQVQRLKAEAGAGATGEGLGRIETALLRMSRLVTRLLELARADAGIGQAGNPQDLAALLDLVLEDSRRDAKRACRLDARLPDRPVRALIDPDAFAILAGNLIDNAFRHAPENSPVTVELSAEGVLTVANDGPPLSSATLRDITRRFRRGAGESDGFGLGLHIAETIAWQSGGSLDLRSPSAECAGGLTATFTALRP